MATRMWIACALIVAVITGGVVVSGGTNLDSVPFTPVANATERKVVCLDGSPSGYNYAPGYGDGANNWMIYLKGGAWCNDISLCQNRSLGRLGTTKFATNEIFVGILSQQQDSNPVFYNWNRVFVYYCDQSSFLGDTEIVGQGPKLQFRGSRIFDAVVEDLLEKGMHSAENAILAGASAGGLATILHCDGFRARLPTAGRVKCISDAGFFIHGQDLANVAFREELFASTISLHNLSSLLPKSCTERVHPSLCFFPQYLIGSVQTPLFILNSAFDSYEIRYNLKNINNSSDKKRWDTCLYDLEKCSTTDKELLEEYGRSFLRELDEIPDIPSRGLFIHTCLIHTVSVDKYWNSTSSDLNVENVTIVAAIGDWYFDRTSVKLIDRKIKFPRPCR